MKRKRKYPYPFPHLEFACLFVDVFQGLAGFYITDLYYSSFTALQPLFTFHFLKTVRKKFCKE